MRSYNWIRLFSAALPLSLFLSGPTFAVSISDTDRISSQSSQNWDSPSFHFVRPNWGFEINYSPNPFGSDALTVSQGSTPFAALKLQAEYQPAFLQKYGVLGIGPSFTLYPLIKSGITPNAFALCAGGAQIRYQARYFHQQVLVPVVAYSLEYMRYQYLDGASGAFLRSGPTLGVWLLLNFLDPFSAGHLYVDNRIARTYFTFEWQLLTGRDRYIEKTSGNAYYFGLRFEF